MRVPEQVTRLGVVIAILAVGVLLVRFVILPPAFFSPRLHQAATIAREIAKPVHYAGQPACAECHGEEVEMKAKGFHKGLACETCHGPSVAHTEDPMNVKPFAPRDRKFCPVCHTYDSARPTGFPQINPESHNVGRPCITCHNPHAPVPPHVPQECDACHAQIARTKSLSAHALLACTTCHTATDKHKADPRANLPSKPQARDFCGQCHATGAPNAEAPKVDMAEHGAPYLCWQCHYPHMPEGRP